MSLPTVDEGLGFITYDDVATNSALLSKQQSDLSGNVTQRQFCIDAFHLAGNRDVSNALIVSDDITTETDNVLAFIGSNVKSVQRTYLSNINISTKNQLFAINAYDMTYGISKLNPLNSKFLISPPFTQLTETKIVASDREANDRFGYSVAISGNYAIVGANGEDPDASGNVRYNAGSAYIFERTSGTWSQKQKIVASDRYHNDFFGISVAISGNYAIVGAYGEDHDENDEVFLSSAGSAYIFERDTDGSWNEVQKIVASDREADDRFGYSVAISGNYAIVGANNEDPDASGNVKYNAGSAYIFERTSGTWSQKQKIVASDRQADDQFGYSVAISGNYAIVGAYTEYHDASGDNPLDRAGSAYIFERTNGSWSQKQKIVASDREADDQFGYSVAISGNYAIVGAYYEDHDASGNVGLGDAGSAYIFERDTDGSWIQKQKIVASDREADDEFGRSVAISGNYAIVGAYNEDHDSSGNVGLGDAGSAYIFERDTDGSWIQKQKIVASDREADDRFGISVAISGNYAIMGAHYEDPGGINAAGAAYIFEG